MFFLIFILFLNIKFFFYFKYALIVFVRKLQRYLVVANIVSSDDLIMFVANHSLYSICPFTSDEFNQFFEPVFI
jgi:hypothetical protein